MVCRKTWIDLLQINEIGDVDGMCRLDPHLLEILILQNHVTAPLEFEAFHDLVGWNFF